MFPNDEVVAYGRANGLGSDYNDIMTAFLRDYYSSNLSLTDLWGRAWAEGFRSINGFTDFPGIANSEFYAPLTHSLVLTRGTGNPTYSRATNAWEFDNEGKLIFVPSGAARFGGARMVRNLITTTSENFSDASWTKVGTCTITGTNIINLPAVNDAVSKYTLSVLDSSIICTVSLSVTLSGVGTVSLFTDTSGGTYESAQQQITLTLTPTRYTFTNTFNYTGHTQCSFKIIRRTGDTATSVTANYAQLENVTGQADQTASEYVSVGVLSAPYHGAGTDGVKYFNTNKDGSTISATSLLGNHAEGARTNSLLWSRDLTKTDYVATRIWQSTQAGTERLTNGDFSSALTGWVTTTGAGDTVSESGGIVTFIASGSVYSDLYQNNVFEVGKRYTISIIATGGTGTLYVNNNISEPRITFSGAGTYTFSISANQTRFTLQRLNGVAANVTIDSISIKEAAIQVTTCTGIDNAANSASTLTAGAADATILQTISMAAAARSFSAYVKRRTGSGNIYITRDGGTSWTDVTSQINSSTWTRVKIENTSVLNPQVGFKIATSGDAIDVDVCQDEAGAFISSPIITTTAAVTRNADVLTYATASNWNNASGSAASTVTPFGGYVANDYTIQITQGGLSAHTAYSGGYLYDGATYVNGPAGAPNATRVKLACTWLSSTQKICVDGSTVNSGAYDGSYGAGAEIKIGLFRAYHKNIYIWQTALTDAQLQQVTS